ncbi:MAG: phosphotransferase [Rhodobiaceae bacterium]|nr:phosphotransferase [Rhodobiaceae bacterium]MCC0041336.1 phosphotransferase [Rhodobiaceae bacterium]
MTAAEERIARLGCWNGRLEISPLKGGLSNESYMVADAGGRHVVRFGRDFPFHHVSREREAMAARAAHAAGFAPAVEHTEPGVMVCAFIEAKTLDAADVRANPERIGTFVRRFHEDMPRHVSGPGFMFWVFHVIRDYARTLKANDSRMIPRLPEFLSLAAELEEAQVAMPIVYGHHDLLPGNFLDDGERLWLIDFEYAGFGTATFDLAGAASNAEMDEAQTSRLLTAYFGHEPGADFLRANAAMQCASLLREAMWSMVSEIFLDAPGADYVAYTTENLERLDAALASYRARYGAISK